MLYRSMIAARPPLRGPTVRCAAAALALAALLGAACTPAGDEGRTAVASLYPLAYAAQRIGGPTWSVVDLTPPGAEAHDIELSLRDREAIDEADLLLVLDPALQPQVWETLPEATGDIRAISEEPLRDPHLWLSPGTYLREIVLPVLDAFMKWDPDENDGGYEWRFRALRQDLQDLTEAYFRTLRPERCEHRMLVVSHEAFGYLARDYGLEQFGLSSLTPEAEPTADRIERARALLAEGEAGAVFYEPDDESERVARSVADDAGAPALPLSTLESEPPEGDYLSVMEGNLESLREGLGCR